MFGYVIASLDDLSDGEKQRYQQVYCGLCRTLGRRHGQPARLSLTYDMTFLILLLTSLYEPPEEAGDLRCAVHPLKRHPYRQNDFTAYAADLTVALTYHKCLDDWQDERKLPQRAYAGWLKARYGPVRERWPRQCRAIEAGLKELDAVERAGGSPDRAAAAFGALLGELFVYRRDEWEKPLRQFGTSLGQFVYVMDAAMDYEQDRKRGGYNPLLQAGQTPEDVYEPLLVLIGRAAEVFEKLPLVEDVHLLRSVLYAGVWQKYNAERKKEQDHGTGPL